jgi:hypothetical protein
MGRDQQCGPEKVCKTKKTKTKEYHSFFMSKEEADILL